MTEIDALLAAHTRDLEHALSAIVEDAAAAIDFIALTAVLSAADDGPVDDHDRDQLEIVLGLERDLLADTLYSSALADGMASLFVAVAALAASAVKHILNPNDTSVVHAREGVVAGFRARYLADTSRAVREAGERMLSATGPASTRAAQIVRVIGLSPAQANSVHALRQALHTYLAVARRNPDVELIVSATRGHLSAAQQRMLRKLLRGDLDIPTAERALDRHAAALRDARAKSIVSDTVHEIAETAKRTGWLVAQRLGKLPAEQRRQWRTAGDERVRHTHAAVPGMNPGGVGLGQPFQTPLGPVMVPPLEYGCRCKAELVAR